MGNRSVQHSHARTGKSVRSGAPRRAFAATLLTALVASLMLVVGGAGSGASADSPVTYTASQTIPVPPASTYAGSGGGDGWDLAFSTTSVYNVFHHSSALTVACHKQVDATACWSPKTVTGPSGEQFEVSSHTTLWMRAGTDKLSIFGTRASDGTGGVVCFDTTKADAATNPFCGFTALTGAGEATLNTGISQISMAAPNGTKHYAFNYVNGAAVPGVGATNKLLCFDDATGAACTGQPITLAGVPSGTTMSTGTFPSPTVAAIGNKILVPVDGSTGSLLTCFDPATNAGCTGSWPVTLPGGYVGNNGTPFPLLDSTGKTIGLCLPTGSDPCYTLSGASTATPAGLGSVISGNTGWNGPAAVLGSRVYVANGNVDQIQCYDYSAAASCANFPHATPGAGFIYTVNPDPQRPACLWVNADFGAGQIQNFDAFGGNACGEGPVRVLASSFVVDTPLCQPATYTSLQVTDPPPSAYTSGSIAFQDGNGATIPGAPPRSLDPTGTVNISDLDLSTASGLPQFLITLNGTTGRPGAVTVKLVWTGVDDPSCVKPGTVVTGGGGGNPEGCPDAFFIALPGNGQAFGGDENLAVSPQLKAIHKAMLTKTAGKEVRVQVVDNHAAGASTLVSGLDAATTEAGLRQALATKVVGYAAGEKAALASLTAMITDDEADCPESRIVLAGYAQGAMAIHDWANAAGQGAHPQVVGLALVADPERVAGSSVPNRGTVPAAAGSQGVCSEVSATVSCAAPDALADVSSQFASRSVQLCNRLDLVCDTSTLVSQYPPTNISRGGLIAVAAVVDSGYLAGSAPKKVGTFLGTGIVR